MGLRIMFFGSSSFALAPLLVLCTAAVLEVTVGLKQKNVFLLLPKTNMSRLYTPDAA